MTLGWEVLRWISRHLPSPADPARPFVLSDAQARVVLDWYALDDKGRFIYRRGLLQEAKGWGKSPEGAALAIAEFAGPVRFARFEHGDPVARPWGQEGDPPAWVQIAACSEDQATSNCYSLVWTMLSENEGRAARELGIDLGRTRLYLKGSPGAKLEAVTSSWGAREGQRVTFGLLDESHNWTKANGGHRLARVLQRNAAKMDGRTLELANAHEAGEGSTAEQTAATFEDGAPGILFSATRPSREPVSEMEDAELRGLLEEVYASAPWVDLERLLREVRDPGVPWSEISRFYFNLPTARTDAWVSPDVWAERARRHRAVEDDSEIVLGFDGSYNGDSTALVGCTVGKEPHIFVVDAWEKPEGAAGRGWVVPREEVKARVQESMSRWNVRELACDPPGWHREIDEWADLYEDTVTTEYATNRRAFMAAACSRFYTAATTGALSHDGDGRLARHLANARLKETPDGAYITKDGRMSPRKIDLAVAAVIAFDRAAWHTQHPPAKTVVWGAI